jgi:colanic acid/amylovoran biosynthesis glycosyltransferase
MTKPAAASFVANFLKPEMLHVYRQISSLERYAPTVLAFKREHEDRFPFPHVKIVPRSGMKWLRRAWSRHVSRQPITLTKGEEARFTAELKACQAAVFHIYFGHIGAMFRNWLSQRPLPTVLSFHGADAAVHLDRSAEREALLHALGAVDLVLVRSEALARDLEKLGCDPGRIRLHRTGLPLDRFGGAVVTRDRSPFVVLQACRFIPKKGLHTTLAAFAAFHKEFPDSKLILAGDGPEKESLENRTITLGIRNHVTFTGFLREEEMLDLYRRASVFIHPSETASDGNREGIPNSLLEAMAAGLPSIATRHGGIPEAIEDGLNGLLIDEGNVRQAAESLVRLARDAALREKLADAGARSVREKFDLKKQGRLLESYYDEAVSRFERRPGKV